ncbi:MAG: hypothetical protein KJN90_02095 [Gammaproteobacteria bacterium]|nr:hypothetical protein [Gammaproteobacteria bacterium]
MQISKREQNILILAGLVAAAFAITSLLPALQSFHQQRSEAIEDINLQIERERRLFDESMNWRSRRAEVESIEAELQNQLFVGETAPIIEANIQRALTQYARDSRISVTSTRLAEQLEGDGWILISQEMAFRTTDAANTINFLQSLEESTPRLWVSDFSIDRTRNQFSGSITVVGFARSEG